MSCWVRPCHLRRPAFRRWISRWPNAGSQTLRQRLELHRQKPECASCHDRMDPLGFGLENFDGIGRWRERMRGSRSMLPVASAAW
ncbi:MAG UNVERIFIED_CONTAM: DUF1588 domain-containing protein [Planctomycetaceae bacterium]